MKTQPSNQRAVSTPSQTRLLLVALAGVCLATMTAMADDKPAGDAKKSDAKCCAAAPAKEKKTVMVVVTGSHIPQRVVLSDNNPKVAAPVSVITREDIDRSGQRTLIGVLSHHASVN